MINNLSLTLINDLIPNHIKNGSPQFVDFINAYFKFLSSRSENTISEMGVLNNIELITDIDETPIEFLNHFQTEFGDAIPQGFTIDPRLFYKMSSQFYLSRGSYDSISSFFRLLFNDDVEIYYPFSDVLIPSSGKWSAEYNTYLNNGGFLSDTKYLQDSYYYQKYSYVLRTGYNIESWRPFFKKLIHPAGMIFFGEVVIFAQAIGQGMPFFQPGFPSGYAADRPIIIDKIFGGVNLLRPYVTFDNTTYPYTGNLPVVFDVELTQDIMAAHDIADYNLTRNLYAFSDMSAFVDKTIEELESGHAGLTNVNVDSIVEFGLADVIEYKYTATATQTIFTGSDDNTNSLLYTIDKVEVYINGYQYTNFTATDGTTVVLGDQANSGDFIIIMSNPYK